MQKVKVSFSDMFSSGDMHEESEGVVGLLPALAALEGVLEPVVLHVRPVHLNIVERDPAKFTGRGLQERLGLRDSVAGDGDQAGHGADALLFRVRHPRYLEGLALPPALAVRGGEGRAGGVAPRVAARVHIGGAPVGASSDDGLLAEVEGSVGRLRLLRCRLAHPAGVQGGEYVRLVALVGG